VTRAGSSRVCGILAFLLSSLCLSLLFWDRPGYIATSDTLGSAEFVWDMLHHPGAWSTFQQPHSPEFVPAELVFGLLQALTDNWRIALAGWIWLMLFGLLALGGRIAQSIAQSQISQADPASVTAAMLLLTFPIMAGAALGFPGFTIANDAGGTFFPWFLLLLPGQHGGTLLLVLAASLVAHHALTHPSTASLIGLGLLCAAAEASDQLCLVSLLVPATAGVLGARLTGEIAPALTIRLLASVWGGATLGGISVLRVERQFMPELTLDYALTHGQRFLAALSQNHGLLLACAVLALALGRDFWRRGVRGTLGGFWPLFALASAGGSLTFMVVFYEDTWSFRYIGPLLWWAVMSAAAWLAEILTGHLRAARGAAAMMCACVCAIWLTTGLSFGFHRPSLLVPASSLAACLRQEGLHTGLADYWIARRTTMDTDWSMQIQPIDSYGAARVWGNDWTWFTHGLRDPARRPDYRFIVLDRLPVERIAGVYGQPDRAVSCGGSLIWVYDGPGRLYDGLKEASPFMAEVFAAAPRS